MRQLMVHAPRGRGRDVHDMAKARNGANIAWFEAVSSGGKPIDMVILSVSNGQVEKLLDDLDALPEVNVTLIPQGVMPLHPPASQASEQVKDVAARSPIEVFLGGLQSVGSWRGFLGYAGLGAVVVWIGLYTNTMYLLVAAMLIAPFAGPAMNTALATARGDPGLLGRSITRYTVALLLSVVVTGILSLVFQQDIATTQMVEVSQISTISVLLPLAAGAAGALNLVQSERNSLVSGAAVGMLTASSLSPPVGLIGMSTAIGRWDMAISGIFVLLLQLVGINLSGALIFRAYGISAEGVRFTRGKAWVFPVSLVVTALLIAGMLLWQFSSRPDLQRSSIAQRARAEVQKAVEASGVAKMVYADVRFTRPSIEGQNTLLVVIYAQRGAETELTAGEISSRLKDDIRSRLYRQGFNVTPLIQVNVLDDQ